MKVLLVFAVLVGVGILAAAFVSTEGQKLSGNEILKKVDERGTFGGLGSRLSIMQFQITNKDGTKQSRKFAFFGKKETGKPDRQLVYFLEPELERGTIFLSIDEVGKKTRLFLYLSALELVKELVSEGERKGSFAGSNLSFADVGGRDWSDDYTAELIGEEKLEVPGKTKLTRSVYVLTLTGKPGADVEFAKAKMWVDKSDFLGLKFEGTNKLGKLERIVELQDLQVFDGQLEPNYILIKNLLDKGQTEVITIEKRKLELPDEIFQPENLPRFDPGKYGVK